MKITSPRLTLSGVGDYGWLMANTDWFVCVEPLLRLFEFPDARYYWLELSTEPSKDSQPIEIHRIESVFDVFKVRGKVSPIKKATPLFPLADRLLYMHSGEFGITTEWKTFYLRLLYED